MSLFEAPVLGIVEGITEYLPISSTGHLILFKLLVAFLPSALIGLLLADRIKAYLFSPVPVLAVRWLVTFPTRRGLEPFGWYRLVLCALMAVLMWNGLVEPT